MNILRKTVRRIERLEALDKVARPLAVTVGRAVRPRMVRNLLSGTYLGEPQHPVLTDLPIGAWVMSALLDAAGGPAAESAADLLVAAGVVAAVPTAAAGLNDWSDTAGPETRVGLVHATLNTTALSLYLASLVARASGRRRGGKALSLAGLGMLTGGAYLGGHLSFGMGVDVNRTAWEQRPSQWTPVLADTEHRVARSPCALSSSVSADESAEGRRRSRWEEWPTELAQDPPWATVSHSELAAM